jgi:hypothetical protein
VSQSHNIFFKQSPSEVDGEIMTVQSQTQSRQQLKSDGLGKGDMFSMRHLVTNADICVERSPFPDFYDPLSPFRFGISDEFYGDNDSYLEKI